MQDKHLEIVHNILQFESDSLQHSFSETVCCCAVMTFELRPQFRLGSHKTNTLDKYLHREI